MTRQQAESLFEQGKEAVVDYLLRLSTRVQALEEQSARNSNNSSKPPSSDGLGKPPLKPMPQSLRKKTGKKPGGQHGRVGRTLLPVDEPGQIVSHRPSACSHCHGTLLDASEVTYARRQVAQIAAISPFRDAETRNRGHGTPGDAIMLPRLWQRNTSPVPPRGDSPRAIWGKPFGFCHLPAQRPSPPLFSLCSDPPGHYGCPIQCRKSLPCPEHGMGETCNL